MTRTTVLLVVMLFGARSHLYAQGGVMPKALIDPYAPSATAQLTVGEDGQVTAVPGHQGINVMIKAGSNPFPGVTIKPAGPAPWDLGLYGHIEIKVANIGSKMIDLNLRVDNEGDYKMQPWNDESKKIEPGQTKTLRVYLGYSYGFRPGFKLNPHAITRLIVYALKPEAALAFRIISVEGAGWVGEKIGNDPDRLSVRPLGGVLLAPSISIQPATQIGADEGAKGSVDAGGSLQIGFTGGKQQSVVFRPPTGFWNLNEALEVKVKLKNIGDTPVTPSVRLESDAGPSDVISTDGPLARGAETEIVIPFAAKIPWNGVSDPEQENPQANKSWGNQPGTGTSYRSNVTSGLTVLSDLTSGAKTIEVTSIKAGLPPSPILPDWLGRKPPVEGDWTQTLDEDFAGNAIDLHRWNVHGPNWYDKRMHFSKDEVIVNNGFLSLRLEKKPGYNNDDPTGKISYSGAKTDYAAGQTDTYGKWTQRYGYFEIREKQPTAKCLWPGFWMMPDRGLKSGLPSLGEREDTRNGGMEFDITESQSSWGIHRFNTDFHWDGYGATANSIGTSANYVQADRDGFIVVGLLWTPGSIVVFGNGKEIFRWDSPRVSNQEAYLILQNQIGGWDNEEVDDTQLPADFVVKYIRVWQRKDLASPEDGPKPNKGDLDVFHETLAAVNPDVLPPTRLVTTQEANIRDEAHIAYVGFRKAFYLEFEQLRRGEASAGPECRVRLPFLNLKNPQTNDKL